MDGRGVFGKRRTMETDASRRGESVQQRREYTRWGSAQAMSLLLAVVFDCSVRGTKFLEC